MGNFITMGRRTALMIIILIYMSPLVLAADNSSSKDPSLFIGDPIATFQKLPAATQEKVKFVVGLVVAAAIIVGLIALFVSHTMTSAGAAVGNAGMRNQGSHNMLMIVGTAIVLVIAVGVFWFFMTGGI